MKTELAGKIDVADDHFRFELRRELEAVHAVMRDFHDVANHFEVGRERLGGVHVVLNEEHALRNGELSACFGALTLLAVFDRKTHDELRAASRTFALRVHDSAVEGDQSID